MSRKPDGHSYTEPSVHTVRLPLWPYMVAPLSCIGAYLFAGFIHHFYTRDAVRAGWAGFVLGVLGLLLLAFTILASRPRGLVMQVMAAANCLLGLLWLAPAILSASGPWSMPMFGLWLAGTAFVTLVAAVYRVMREKRGDTGGVIINGEVTEMTEAVKELKNVARFGKPKIEGARVQQAIEMTPGAPFKEVAQAKEAIASFHDVPVTAVRTTGSMDSARRGTLSVVPVDQLRDPIDDPGLPDAGMSIAEPIVVGRDERRAPVELILPGDPKVHRNAVGLMGVVGMSGSGKTEWLLRLAKVVATRHDSELHIADARKAGQLPDWGKRAAKSVHAGKQATLDLLEGLETRVAQRSETLGAAGYNQWVEGCGIPFETYIIFEANAILMDSNIIDLAESVRSTGICLVLEMQRATFDRVPTSARAQITTWVCLGVQKPDDAEAALSEATFDAGAAPWAWKNKRPGYFYFEWAGRPEELWATPNRGFIQSNEERERDVAEALGWDDEPAVPAPRRPDDQVMPYAPPSRNGATPDGDEPAGGEDVGDGEEWPDGSPIDPDDPPPDIDPATPIRQLPDDAPVIEFGSDRTPMSPEAALDFLRSKIFDLSTAGVSQVRASDLSDVVHAVNRGSGWIYKALKILSEPGGPLRKTERGYYKVLRPEPAGAGNGR